MHGTTIVPGSRGGQSRWARLVNTDEQYGSEIVQQFLGGIESPSVALDIGAGAGRDLGLVKRAHPAVKTLAVECFNTDLLRQRFDAVYELDIERAALPLAERSVDLVIANQVLEHLKEIFWVWHEVSRVLSIGGHFLVGVPNIASLHNRLLLGLGKHPTQWKSYSAHVRPFSKPDTLKFVDVCFPGGYELVAFRGSQFYPLPRSASRAMCALFPSAAAFIFFLFRKKREYHREFLEHPVKARLQTNFFLG
ncbi:MAG TPA: class I SAM-dependent methyltransferase [Steroidobacteraceae bacterium]|jgi:SAM-dependent methyltransferase|nr:class I SAM-dependent methyltransferase [Steroidobacteraceae bacterium]